jgi:hypothetical protein
VVSSHPITLYKLARLWTASPRGVKPPGWAIRLGVDYLSPWWTRSLMEKPAFTNVNLSNVVMIMTIMHVLTEELVCQAVMRLILKDRRRRPERG